VRYQAEVFPSSKPTAKISPKHRQAVMRLAATPPLYRCILAPVLQLLLILVPIALIDSISPVRIGVMVTILLGLVGVIDALGYFLFNRPLF